MGGSVVVVGATVVVVSTAGAWVVVGAVTVVAGTISVVAEGVNVIGLDGSSAFRLCCGSPQNPSASTHATPTAITVAHRPWFTGDRSRGVR